VNRKPRDFRKFIEQMKKSKSAGDQSGARIVTKPISSEKILDPVKKVYASENPKQPEGEKVTVSVKLENIVPASPE